MFRRLITVCLFLACSGMAHATFSGYTYRRTIAVDHTKVPNTDQTAFPVLVSETNITLSTITASGGHVSNSSGYDIIFSTMADCSYKLKWDTETYNATTGNLIAWVNVPTVSHTSDTSFYLCYGSSTISSFQGNTAATWDSNFVGVWHMNQGSGSALDSTSLANTATAVGSPTYNATGQIGKALSFNGSSSGLDIANESNFDFERTSSFTITMWVNPAVVRSGANTEYALFSKLQATSPFPGFEPSLIWGDAGLFPTETRLQYYMIHDYPGNNMLRAYSSTDITNAMHCLQISYSGTSHVNGFAFFLDGVQDTMTVWPASQFDTLSASILNNTDPNVAVRGSGTWAPGVFDEVRVSNVVRSADWLKTEYNNQFSPSTFYSLGSESTGAHYSQGFHIRARN